MTWFQDISREAAYLIGYYTLNISMDYPSTSPVEESISPEKIGSEIATYLHGFNSIKYPTNDYLVHEIIEKVVEITKAEFSLEEVKRSTFNSLNKSFYNHNKLLKEVEACEQRLEKLSQEILNFEKQQMSANSSRKEALSLAVCKEGTQVFQLHKRIIQLAGDTLKQIELESIDKLSEWQKATKWYVYGAECGVRICVDLGRINDIRNPKANVSLALYKTQHLAHLDLLKTVLGIYNDLTEKAKFEKQFPDRSASSVFLRRAIRQAIKQALNNEMAISSEQLAQHLFPSRHMVNFDADLRTRIYAILDSWKESSLPLQHTRFNEDFVRLKGTLKWLTETKDLIKKGRDIYESILRDICKNRSSSLIIPREIEVEEHHLSRRAKKANKPIQIRISRGLEQVEKAEHPLLEIAGAPDDTPRPAEILSLFPQLAPIDLRVYTEISEKANDLKRSNTRLVKMIKQFHKESEVSSRLVDEMEVDRRTSEIENHQKALSQGQAMPSWQGMLLLGNIQILDKEIEFWKTKITVVRQIIKARKNELLARQNIANSEKQLTIANKYNYAPLSEEISGNHQHISLHGQQAEELEQATTEVWHHLVKEGTQLEPLINDAKGLINKCEQAWLQLEGILKQSNHEEDEQVEDLFEAAQACTSQLEQLLHTITEMPLPALNLLIEKSLHESEALQVQAKQLDSQAMEIFLSNEVHKFFNSILRRVGILQTPFKTWPTA